MRGSANETERSTALTGLSGFQDMRWELCVALGCPEWTYELIRRELRDIEHDAVGRVSDPGVGSPWGPKGCR